MAVVVEEVGTPLVQILATVELVFTTAPAQGDLVIVGFIHNSARTITRPTAEIDGSWTTLLGPIALGSDGSREISVELAVVGSGSDTSWQWLGSPTDLLGIHGFSVSGANKDGTIWTEDIVDASSPAVLGPLDGDPSPDPTTEYGWFFFGGTKWFGATAAAIFSDDDGFTDHGSGEVPTGTRWANTAWSKILTTGKPTVTVTNDKSNATGTGILVGIPATSGAAPRVPPRIRRPVYYPRRKREQVFT